MFLKSCLLESGRQNLSSIAFPAMGTDNLGYPRDMVAEVMCNSVLNFSKENPNTSLKQVLFVVYEKDTQTFQVFFLICNPSICSLMCLYVCYFTSTTKIRCLLLKYNNTGYRITCFTQSRLDVLIIRYHTLQAFETEIQKQAMKIQSRREINRHCVPGMPQGTCTHFVNNLNNLNCMIVPS